MVLLIVFRSSNSLHLPDFFYITNMGVLHGLWVGSICPASSCTHTNSSAAFNFSSNRGHRLTQTGISASLVILAAVLGVGDMIKTPLENSDKLIHTSLLSGHWDRRTPPLLISSPVLLGGEILDLESGFPKLNTVYSFARGFSTPAEHSPMSASHYGSP